MPAVALASYAYAALPTWYIVPVCHLLRVGRIYSHYSGRCWGVYISWCWGWDRYYGIPSWELYLDGMASGVNSFQICPYVPFWANDMVLRRLQP